MKASEAIKDAICDGGTPVAQCDFCGVTHYAVGGYLEEGELARLEAKRKEAPAFFSAHADRDCVSIGHIEGRKYVWDCGCKESEERLSRIENFLWEHQVIVSHYYRNRIKAMKDEAALREKLVEPPTDEGG